MRRREFLGSLAAPLVIAPIERLRAQTPVNAGKWTRDELYEDEPGR